MLEGVIEDVISTIQSAQFGHKNCSKLSSSEAPTYDKISEQRFPAPPLTDPRHAKATGEMHAARTASQSLSWLQLLRYSVAEETRIALRTCFSLQLV